MVTRDYPYYQTETRRFSRTAPPPPHQSPYQRGYPTDRRYQLLTHDTGLTHQTMPEDSETTPTRKRIAVACGRCRKRKIRCSGDPGQGQSCSNCKSAGAEPCLFLRVQSTETPLRADPQASYGYNVDTARRFHSGPAASPIAYDTSDLSSPNAVPDMMAYRNYYPKAAENQSSSYYGVPPSATNWASSSMPPTYADDATSGVGVDYSGMQTQYSNQMMPLYGAASTTRWAGSKASGSQVYVADPAYSSVYSSTASSTGSEASGMTAMARSDPYAAPGPFPGMGRMAASLPTPPALVDTSKMGAMLPTPSSSSRTPLPSSPGSYRMLSSVHMPDGQPSSSPVESGGSAAYYEYPPQSSGLGSTGTPVSATRSTLPGNGSSVSITSSTSASGTTDSGMYASGHGAVAAGGRDDAYASHHHHHQSLHMFRTDQDLKSQSSNDNLDYMYAHGSSGTTSSVGGYSYEPAGVEMPPSAATASSSSTRSRRGDRTRSGRLRA